MTLCLSPSTLSFPEQIGSPWLIESVQRSSMGRVFVRVAKVLPRVAAAGVHWLLAFTEALACTGTPMSR